MQNIVRMVALPFGIIASIGSLAAQSRSDLTDQLDRLAVSHLDGVQELSIRDNVEYCGYFGFDNSGEIVATPATRGDSHSCESKIVPPELDIIASYHTHGAYSEEDESELPSSEDLLVDFEAHTDGYVATPSGRVWLNLVDEAKTVQLCGPGCVRADPNAQSCKANAILSEYRVRDLQKSETEDIHAC